MSFDPTAATEAYLHTLTAAATARSDAYFEGGYWLILWDFVVTVAVGWLFLGTGLSSRIRTLAERATRFRWLQAGVYAVIYIVLSTIVVLPWSAYEGYFREHAYGMSTQTLGGWLGDQGKGLILSVLFGALAMVLVYAVFRRSPRRWWFWSALVTVAILVFQIAIAPTYLEPVFNKFYPLADSPIKARILSMARANGIPVTQVYEFDASRQTTKMSAHVSGLFGTAQISVNDNLMKRGSPEEIEAVVGHEMGHYVLNHVSKSLLPLAVIVMFGFLFLARTFDRVIRTSIASRWGIRDITDPAGLPLVVVLFSLYLFVLTPVINSLVRTQEIEADAFGLSAAREPDGFAQAALHLSEYRKMRPGKLEEILFFDHPSGWNRIHAAMTWKAENLHAPDIAAYDQSHHPPGTP